MKSFSIKRAERSDFETLSKISVESKKHWGYPDEWMKLWIKDLMISSEYIEQNFVYKVMIEVEIAGFISLEEDKEVYEIAHLWIKPKFMRMGLGKMLLNKVVANVVKPGGEILVESDPNAEQFYINLGFETFGKKESLPKGRFLPLMKKKIIT